MHESDPINNNQTETSQTEWDTLSQEVPFQGEEVEKPEQKRSRNMGESYRKMYHEVDLSADEYTERFREGKIYEDAAKYRATPYTEIHYIDETPDGEHSGTVEVEGWIDDLATVQPYKRDLSRKYPPAIENLLAPSSDRECKVTKLEKLYRVNSDGYSERGVTPEEFNQQYIENEDGTFHNTELLRIIKAKPEETWHMDKETLELADKTEYESGILYAFPMTEYFTAPVNLGDPDDIPKTGRRAVMDIRPGYGFIK